MKYITEINKRPECKGYITNKKEVENYIHKDAIIDAYKTYNINLNISNNFNDFDDIPLEVAKAVHGLSASSVLWDNLDEDKKEKKMSNAKKTLNSIAVSKMNKKLLEEIDAKNEIIGWFKDIKDMMK